MTMQRVLSEIEVVACPANLGNYIYVTAPPLVGQQRTKEYTELCCCRLARDWSARRFELQRVGAWEVSGEAL